MMRQYLTREGKLAIADLRLPAKGKRLEIYWFSCRFCDRRWRWRAVSNRVHGYDPARSGDKPAASQFRPNL
ncbi:hypothetical protein MPLB_1200167 [Mesorhizobium sp. ORS 3324]|nr:hypothetical protein MPLB_1200167 [Mesorhizobium sp. ORS 3324]